MLDLDLIAGNESSSSAITISGHFRYFSYYMGKII